MTTSDRIAVTIALAIVIILSLALYNLFVTDRQEQDKGIATHTYINYIQDMRTGICIGYSGPNVTPFVVPCEKIPKEILKRIEK